MKPNRYVNPSTQAALLLNTEYSKQMKRDQRKLLVSRIITILIPIGALVWLLF